MDRGGSSSSTTRGSRSDRSRSRRRLPGGHSPATRRGRRRYSHSPGRRSPNRHSEDSMQTSTRLGLPVDSLRGFNRVNLAHDPASSRRFSFPKSLNRSPLDENKPFSHDADYRNSQPDYMVKYNHLAHLYPQQEADLDGDLLKASSNSSKDRRQEHKHFNHDKDDRLLDGTVDQNDFIPGVQKYCKQSFSRSPSPVDLHELELDRQKREEVHRNLTQELPGNSYRFPGPAKPVWPSEPHHLYTPEEAPKVPKKSILRKHEGDPSVQPCSTDISLDAEIVLKQNKDCESTSGPADQQNDFLLPHERASQDGNGFSCVLGTMADSTSAQEKRKHSLHDHIEDKEKIVYDYGHKNDSHINSFCAQKLTLAVAEKTVKQKVTSLSLPSSYVKTGTSEKSQQEYEKIQDLLKTIGLDIGLTEIGKLAARTQERLHGKNISRSSDRHTVTFHKPESREKHQSRSDSKSWEKHQSRSDTDSKSWEKHRSRSDTDSKSREKHQSRSDSDSKSREKHQSRSDSDSKSREKHRSRSDSDSKSREKHQSRSDADSKSREKHQSRSDSDSKSREKHRSRSDTDSKFREKHQSRSDSDSESQEKHQSRSDTDSPEPKRKYSLSPPGSSSPSKDTFSDYNKRKTVGRDNPFGTIPALPPALTCLPNLSPSPTSFSWYNVPYITPFGAAQLPQNCTVPTVPPSYIPYGQYVTYGAPGWPMYAQQGDPALPALHAFHTSMMPVYGSQAKFKAIEDISTDKQSLCSDLDDSVLEEISGTAPNSELSSQLSPLTLKSAKEKLSDEQNRVLQRQKVKQEIEKLKSDQDAWQKQLFYLKIEFNRLSRLRDKMFRKSKKKNPLFVEVVHKRNSIEVEVADLTIRVSAAEEKKCELDKVAQILGINIFEKSWKPSSERRESSEKYD
ncbi:zinc finger protein 318-like isoform X1 [Anolis sagrei]|uniref:zinc finger protein 318-like isoform X1 n=2 Tax=Anolis sagrei TaxID=38937 RepID=UPI003521F587